METERNESEWEITFTLAADRDEQDAFELYELIEQHPATTGAALVETLARHDSRTTT